MSTLQQSPPRTDAVLTLRDYALLFALMLPVYLTGLFVPLMDNDSAHHANIALQLYLSGDYTSLLDNGVPYLDKPHLLFWTAALAYKVFGVTAFAYKLPSFLFTLLGTYATFRLGSLLYNKEAGRLAALILATAFAYVLANNDVRMDAMLTGAVIFSVWQLVAYTRYQKWPNLVLAALGLALGFATKGLIGVAVPAIALFLYLTYERNWRMLFHWPWLVLVALFFAFASPVLYAYYLQFDLNPALEVRGKTGISGVRFILWDQNFERMQGEAFGAEGKIEYGYFLHTFLWTFMPWSLLVFPALLARLRAFALTKFRFTPHLEALTVGGIMVFMFLFSLSRFKLPHYLNVLLPLFAVLLAGWLHANHDRESKTRLFWRVQVFAVLVMVAGSLLLNLWLFPVEAPWVILVALLLFASWLRVGFGKQPVYRKTIYWTALGAALAFFLLHANFYPQLLRHQGGNALAQLTQAQGIAPSQVYYFETGHSFSYDFNMAHLHTYLSLHDIQQHLHQQEPLWLVTEAPGLARLQEQGIPIRQQFAATHYRVSRLKWEFLNPGTRSESLTPIYLIQL